MRNLIDNLLGRLAETRLPNIRPALARLRELANRVVDHVSTLRLPRARLFIARSRGVSVGLIASLKDRVNEIRLPRRRLPRGTMRTGPDDLPGRFGVLKWRLRTSRLGRSADGIIVVPLLGVVLVLGVFTATAATHRSSDGTDSVLSPTGTTGDVLTGGFITTTITRGGETVRIVRYRTKPGRVISETISGRSVTLPGQSVTFPGDPVTLPGQTKTLIETRTQTVTNTTTTQQIITVTETQPVTTTVVETVTSP